MSASATHGGHNDDIARQVLRMFEPLLGYLLGSAGRGSSRFSLYVRPVRSCIVTQLRA